MNYKINFENYKSNFSLPSKIVDSNLKDIDGDYLKIILQIFIHPDTEYSVNLLSNLLEIPLETVEKAVAYWIEREVLIAHEVTSPKVSIISQAKQKTNFQPTLDTEINFLIGCMEDVLQRAVVSNDIKSVVYIYETYRLPVDVILMAIQYCVSLGKKDIRYIEKVCTEWYNEGITSHTLAEAYLQLKSEKKTTLYKIKKLFGIDRALSTNEKKYIENWLDELGFGVDVIEIAYQRMIDQIGKVAFAYINKILQNWHASGYKTVEDICKNESYISKKCSTGKQTTYDIDMLDNFWDNVPDK